MKQVLKNVMSAVTIAAAWVVLLTLAGCPNKPFVYDKGDWYHR